MTRSENMELVEVLERLLDRVAALDAAIAALSAPQPPAEAQPVACGPEFRGLDAQGRPLYGPANPAPVTTTPGTAPPSAPVGVEAVRALKAKYQQHIDADHFPYHFWRDLESALAQQPAADGGFTAADMMDARQEGRKEAQQSAGFSAGDMADASAQGFRAGVESVQQSTAVDDDTLESLIEESDGHWSEDEFRIEGPELMRLLRDAALAGHQGGAKCD